ncbi:MAG: DUF2844 domain-containing protein, partial [Candidatus Dormibacteraeota bacterium]|nr:DUF2844 domain-containing protein [Candidatus Dormibacteraeota bacterium]
FAARGADAASIEADRVHLKGAVHVTSVSSYHVHEIQTPAGTVVREYLSAAGQVFAVTWRGPGIPDLRQLLGSYSAQLDRSGGPPHYNHHHLEVRTPDVVVQSSGHARGFFGRAWAPALLPPEVTARDIG